MKVLVAVAVGSTIKISTSRMDVTISVVEFHDLDAKLEVT
jgi:hypothetical protein